MLKASGISREESKKNPEALVQAVRYPSNSTETSPASADFICSCRLSSRSAWRRATWARLRLAPHLVCHQLRLLAPAAANLRAIPRRLPGTRLPRQAMPLHLQATAPRLRAMARLRLATEQLLQAMVLPLPATGILLPATLQAMGSLPPAMVRPLVLPPATPPRPSTSPPRAPAPPPAGLLQPCPLVRMLQARRITRRPKQAVPIWRLTRRCCRAQS